MTVLSPFQRILDAVMGNLPGKVAKLHSLREQEATAGRAEITTDGGLGPWFICKVAGLPRPGQDVPVSVTFIPNGTGRETWHRRFASRRYVSVMAAGVGRDEGLLIEHLGPFDLLFQLTPQQDGLAWSLSGWRLLGLPLPSWSKPSIECLESGDDRRFIFDIDVAFPLVGHIIHYRGWLESEKGDV